MLTDDRWDPGTDRKRDLSRRGKDRNITILASVRFDLRPRMARAANPGTGFAAGQWAGSIDLVVV